MALHRDIFWIGRQWAVTGSGMQAINQKHGGEFDIPIERLWDDDLSGAVCEQKWFNADDFNKGLAVALSAVAGPARTAEAGKDAAIQTGIAAAAGERDDNRARACRSTSYPGRRCARDRSGSSRSGAGETGKG